MCGEAGHLEAMCKKGKPQQQEQSTANAASITGLEAPRWKCFTCDLYQHHDGDKCRATWGCKGTKKRFDERVLEEAELLQKKERLRTKTGTEVVGRLLQEDGGDDPACVTNAVAEHARKQEQLSTLIKALEDIGDVEHADKRRKELAKLKAPPMQRPAQDRASLNARLAELEVESEEKTAHLNNQRCKLLEEQEAVVKAREREVAAAEEQYKKTLEVIHSQHKIAAQLIDKKIRHNTSELQQYKEEFEAKVKEVNRCLTLLQASATPMIEAVGEQLSEKGKEGTAYVTADQVNEEEMKALMLVEPGLQGIEPEHAGRITKWLCALLNLKAAENVGATSQLQKMMLQNGGGGRPLGSATVQANGQAQVEQQPSVGQEQNEDEDMTTDISESEAEEEARKMNGDWTKVKKRVKKSEAKKIREGRGHKK